MRRPRCFWACTSASLGKHWTSYVIIFSVAGFFVIFRLTMLEWWQALLLAAGVLATALGLAYTRAKHVVFLLLVVAAPLSLVITQVSIFWVVSGPDTTVAVTITGKEHEVISDPRMQHESYSMRVVDDYGRRYKIGVFHTQWQGLDEGDKTSITYHTEAVGGRWLSRRVVTHLGNESVGHGGGRFGSPAEGFGTVTVMLISAAPLAFLVWVWVWGGGKEEMQKMKEEMQKIGQLAQMKVRMHRKVSEDPGISSTGLCRSVEGNSDLKELAIAELLDEGKLRCEQRGRGRHYFLLKPFLSRRSGGTGAEPIKTYCHTCRALREIKKAKQVAVKNAPWADFVRGVCAVCGTEVGGPRLKEAAEEEEKVDHELAREIADCLKGKGVEAEPLTDDQYEQVPVENWALAKYLHESGVDPYLQGAGVRLRHQDVDTLYIVPVPGEARVTYRAEILSQCPKLLRAADEEFSVSLRAKRWKDDGGTKLERRLAERLNQDAFLRDTLASSRHTNVNVWLTPEGKYIAINTAKHYTQVEEIDEFLNVGNLIAKHLKQFGL